MKESITKKPQFIEKKYKKMYKEPYKEFLEYGDEWYKGRGADWKDHPLKVYIPKWASVCAKCKEDAKIIAAHCEIDIDTDEPKWDIEVFCKKCKRYTQRSYKKE